MQQQHKQHSQEQAPLPAASSSMRLIKSVDPSSTHHDSSSPPGALASAPPPKPPLLQRLAAIGRDHFITPQAQPPAPPPMPPLLQRLAGIGRDHFMPISFLVATILAISWPAPGAEVASWKAGDIRIVQAINNALVFLISGLTLRSDDFRAMLYHWVGVLFGFVAILVVTPCLGFGLVRLPLQPREFAVGLAIFSVVPTTLGVGVALTAASKGNQALALLLTVGTNLLGIITVPYELRLVLAGNQVLSVDPAALVLKLIITVLVPTVIGKAAREASARVRSFVATHKVQLSMFSTLNLALIVWQTLSGAQPVLVQQAFTSILVVIVLAVAMHVLYLLASAVAVSCFGLRLPLREAIAVMIMSSQKSAPVAVTVISYITPDIAQQGLFAIPAIVGQLAQIFIGSVLARYLRSLVNREEQE